MIQADRGRDLCHDAGIRAGSQRERDGERKRDGEREREMKRERERER